MPAAALRIVELDHAEAAEPLPPARPWLPSRAALTPYLDEIDAARRYSNFGPQLEAFEAGLAARFAQPTHAVTVSSGTQGIALALQAMGAQPGWVCALPAWTFVATAHAVMQAGLTPWFLDVDAADGMLSPETVRGALARAPGPIAAVVPVSAHGQIPDLSAWARFREETALPVLLDAAAAFDALSDAAIPAIVSLHATKALGVGEGGYLATEDGALAQRMRELTNFGFRGSRESQTPSANAKLSEYAAAVGRAALDAWPATRGRYMRGAQWLRIALAATPEVSFQPGWGTAWISTTCVVRLDRAATPVEQAMAEVGVQTRRWWGAGCHASPAFARAPRTALPVSETLADISLGLPFWADMTIAEADRVAQALISGLRDLAR